MDSGTWINLLVGFVGVVVGSTIPVIGNLLAKRAERRNEISKLMAQKRLEAYEEVITKVRFASIGSGETAKGEFVRIPLILEDLGHFEQWFSEYVVICRRVSHLIDGVLSEELWVFQNYLHMLSEYLGKCRDKDGVAPNMGAVHEIGKIVYNDFRFLTERIIRQASKFFSTEIYNPKFQPSTIRDEPPKKTLPEYFKKLAIISRKEEIERLASSK